MRGFINDKGEGLAPAGIFFKKYNNKGYRPYRNKLVTHVLNFYLDQVQRYGAFQVEFSNSVFSDSREADEINFLCTIHHHCIIQGVSVSSIHTKRYHRTHWDKEKCSSTLMVGLWNSRNYSDLKLKKPLIFYNLFQKKNCWKINHKYLGISEDLIEISIKNKKGLIIFFYFSIIQTRFW